MNFVQHFNLYNYHQHTVRQMTKNSTLLRLKSAHSNALKKFFSKKKKFENIHFYQLVFSYKKDIFVTH